MNRHPCKRDVCECDKQFAVNVAKYEHEWKEEYHIKRAGFDRYSSCRPTKERIILHLSFAIYVRTKKKSFQSLIPYLAFLAIVAASNSTQP